MSVREGAGLAAIVALVSTLAWLGVRYLDTQKANEALREATSTYALQLATREGIRARVAEERDELLATLADTTEAFGRVMARLERIQAENTRLARLLAIAETEETDTGTVHQATVDTAERPCEECLLPGDSVTGEWAGGAFTSDWTFVAMNRLRQQLSAEIRAEMVTTELPDGRVAIFPRSRTEGAELQVQEFIWDPPPPPNPTFDFGTALLSTPVGAALGLGACVALH